MSPRALVTSQFYVKLVIVVCGNSNVRKCKKSPTFLIRRTGSQRKIPESSYNFKAILRLFCKCSALGVVQEHPGSAQKLFKCRGCEVLRFDENINSVVLVKNPTIKHYLETEPSIASPDVTLVQISGKGKTGIYGKLI